jgi:hypothetical protein
VPHSYTRTRRDGLASGVTLLGSIWDGIAADGERRRRALEQAESRRTSALLAYEARAQQAAAVTDRAERSEQVRGVRAAQETEAARLDADLQAAVAELTGLLKAAAREPARDLAAFHRSVPTEDPPTIDDVALPPRPEWSQFAPPLPGRFGWRRYERAVIIARTELDTALASHDRRRLEAFEELSRAHRTRAACRRQEHEAEWDAMAEAVSSADPDAVSRFAGMILQASPVLRGFIHGGRATYEAPERSSSWRSTCPTPTSSRPSATGSTLSPARLSKR